MTCSIDLRERVAEFVRSGGSGAFLGVSRKSVYIAYPL